MLDQTECKDLFIQSYFQNGKAKKHNHRFSSEKEITTLFEFLHEGKAVRKNKVKENFSKRDIIYPDGSKVNLWKFLSENGFYSISLFHHIFLT